MGRNVTGNLLSNNAMEKRLWDLVSEFHDGCQVHKMSVRVMSKAVSRSGEQEHVDLGLYGVRLMTLYLQGEDSYVVKVRGTSGSSSWEETVHPGNGYTLGPESVRDCSHQVGPTTSRRVVGTMGYMLEGDEQYLRSFARQKACWGGVLHWTMWHSTIITEAARDRAAFPTRSNEFWNNSVLHGFIYFPILLSSVDFIYFPIFSHCVCR